MNDQKRAATVLFLIDWFKFSYLTTAQVLRIKLIVGRGSYLFQKGCECRVGILSEFRTA